MSKWGIVVGTGILISGFVVYKIYDNWKERNPSRFEVREMLDDDILVNRQNNVVNSDDELFSQSNIEDNIDTEYNEPMTMRIALMRESRNLWNEIEESPIQKRGLMNERSYICYSESGYDKSP